MGLVKIHETVVTSGVSSVDIGGSNWDSSYETYLGVIQNLSGATDNTYTALRILDNTNSMVTSSLYNQTHLGMTEISNSSFGGYITANSFIYLANNRLGLGTHEVSYALFYLYRFNDSSSYSYFTQYQVNIENGGKTQGLTGGGVLKQNAQHRGFRIYQSSGNIDDGTFTLYGITS
jgi:hypothetical protein